MQGFHPYIYGHHLQHQQESHPLGSDPTVVTNYVVPNAFAKVATQQQMAVLGVGNLLVPGVGVIPGRSTPVNNLSSQQFQKTLPPTAPPTHSGFDSTEDNSRLRWTEGYGLGGVRVQAIHFHSTS